ncbi:MAG: hypothetical protein EOO24_15860, partial [Comamonadaceae bacterium]
MREAVDFGSRLGIARLDSQLLLLHALDRPLHDRAWLLAHDTDPLPDHAARRHEALCRRRAAWSGSGSVS